MKKEKRKYSFPRLLPYFTRRIGLVLLGLWLTCMVLLTVGTAQYVRREIINESYDFPETTERVSWLDEYYPTEEGSIRHSMYALPGSSDYRMLESITRTGLNHSYPSGGIYAGNSIKLNTAILYVDAEENIIHQNGDFLYFHYSTADTWAQQSMDTDGYAWVDLSDESDERFSFIRQQYIGLPVIDFLFDWEALRMTGWFEGSRFEPLSMDLADRFDRHYALEKLPYYSPHTTVAQLDAMGLIEWEEHFDYTAHAPTDKELVTIYGQRLSAMLYVGDPVRYQGETYADLVTLLGTMGYYRDESSSTFHQGESQKGLWNTVVFGCRSYWDLSEYDFSSNEPWPDPVITMLTAVQASPLLIAMKYLRNIYLITGALVLIIFFWLRSLVKDHVFLPLKTVNDSIAAGWVHLPAYLYAPPELSEAAELVSHYRSTQQQLYGCKNEVARLSAALNYAHSAEENRRQMTSHIAHELKTPLAIIHSYTEGLQEHIAEEKREKYLQVILSETERMDAMVLEMLDLSRLEAGRVKLQQDEFSLLVLCRDVFDKLALALQAKELQVEYTCHCSAVVTADESRIRQVVENFATNAVKHTPHGGTIRVHIYTTHDGTTFSMENDGPSLPQEVLDKVWDSFWRQDESRTSPGTGLGLAIAKSIITLHGGQCAACNTSRGVEFRFRI